MSAAVAVNLLLTVVQIVGGIVSGSLALIADAIHNFSDAMSLLLAVAARRISRRKADSTMTFGWDRAELVAALINLTTLILIALYLAAEGIMRLADPPGVDGWIVIWVAGFALIVDTVTVALTYRLSRNSLNIRAAFLHNVADALGSVAVIIVGTLILLYDWRLLDPIATLGISAYILWHALSDMRPTIHILMLGAPDNPDREEVRNAFLEHTDIEDVHHLHLWQIDEHRCSVEAHVILSETALPRAPEVVSDLKAILSDRFGIGHATIEVETRSSGCAGRHPRQA
ncbi:MAG: cation diffusion facilitator family transporter [Silicimonas sp.]